MKKIAALFCAFCLLFSLAAAGFAVSPLGDTDGDGAVTPADARAVLRVSVRLDEPGEYADAMDVDADGHVTAADARLVLRRAVGIIMRFPPEMPIPVPREENAFSLTVEAPRALLYEAEDNTILFQKEIDERTAPASTIKLLTALTALKYCDPEKEFTVGDEIYLIGWDSSVCGLEEGMIFTLRQLLYGMLLPSGNDAAFCIAANVGRTLFDCDDTEDAVRRFVSLMNHTAWEIGMDHTNVVSPDGYDAPGQHTTARDLLTLARTALDNELILQICATRAVTFDLLYEETDEPEEKGPTTAEEGPAVSEEETTPEEGAQNGESGEEPGEKKEEKPTDITWYSTNRFLNQGDRFYDRRVFGLKGGFTDDAGCCLIAAYRHEDKTYIAIVMGANSFDGRYECASAMMNAAAAGPEPTVPPVG
ncbi:MAG: D-alanyl-D-alanine carboxypeptidase [Clostridia bacterium]|nr:D-alanyl-D-alanine carboxypeptidase [Clostridia bacterium]